MRHLTISRQWSKSNILLTLLSQSSKWLSEILKQHSSASRPSFYNRCSVVCLWRYLVPWPIILRYNHRYQQSQRRLIKCPNHLTINTNWTHPDLSHRYVTQWKVVKQLFISCCNSYIKSVECSSRTDCKLAVNIT